MNIFKKDFIPNEIVTTKSLLEYVTQEEIFELVLGYKPIEYERVTSPLREDNSPDCWFEYVNGKLRFKDFGSQVFIRGKLRPTIDCFDMVQQYFNLKNYQATLDYIHNSLVKGKKSEKLENPYIFSRKQIVEKDKFYLEVQAREFLLEDKYFWEDRYEISRENLIEDIVFPLERYKMYNTKKGDIDVFPHTLAYCYADFEEGSLKVYRPLEKEGRFITNCTQNAIYGLRHLPKIGKKLIISKSYKDYRVLKNQGYNVIAFQNEGMIPSLDILLPICSRFEEVIIFFDNDETGVKNSVLVSDIINSYIPGKSRALYLPVRLLTEYGISDPSDLIYKSNRKDLLIFLSKNI